MAGYSEEISGHRVVDKTHRQLADELGIPNSAASKNASRRLRRPDCWIIEPRGWEGPHDADLVDSRPCS